MLLDSAIDADTAKKKSGCVRGRNAVVEFLFFFGRSGCSAIFRDRYRVQRMRGDMGEVEELPCVVKIQKVLRPGRDVYACGYRGTNPGCQKCREVLLCQASLDHPSATSGACYLGDREGDHEFEPESSGGRVFCWGRCVALSCAELDFHRAIVLDEQSEDRRTFARSVRYRGLLAAIGDTKMREAAS